MRILHTMLRVGDLKRSIDFYTNVLGMRVLRQRDYPDGRFTLAFVGYGAEDEEAVLELTYQAQVTPWMTLQPTLQRVFHPGGNVLNPDGSIRRDALILGLRSALTF